VSKLRPFAPRPPMTFVPPPKSIISLGKRTQREEVKESEIKEDQKMIDNEEEAEVESSSEEPSKRLRKENSIHE
jgi:hypothetical protein